jgi:GMP synthase-like glutamine amidotransferase
MKIRKSRFGDVKVAANTEAKKTRYNPFDPMRIHYLQHVPFEGPAHIATWASSRGHRLAGTRLHAGEPLPELSGLDWLVVMGGPMGANDEREHPWMRDEKALIEEAIAEGKPVVGVCLGAQLIASVLGAKVYRNAHKEIGWFPVRKAPGLPTSSAFAGAPAIFTPLHWHGDTFDLPTGSRRLASSEGCTNQAFEYRSALALQFHIEASEDSVRALLDHCAREIGEGPYEQDPIVLGDCKAQVAAIRPILFSVLDRLATA